MSSLDRRRGGPDSARLSGLGYQLAAISERAHQHHGVDGVRPFAEQAVVLGRTSGWRAGARRGTHATTSAVSRAAGQVTTDPETATRIIEEARQIWNTAGPPPLPSGTIEISRADPAHGPGVVAMLRTITYHDAWHAAHRAASANVLRTLDDLLGPSRHDQTWRQIRAAATDAIQADRHAGPVRRTSDGRAWLRPRTATAATWSVGQGSMAPQHGSSRTHRDSPKAGRVEHAPSSKKPGISTTRDQDLAASTDNGDRSATERCAEFPPSRKEAMMTDPPSPRRFSTLHELVALADVWPPPSVSVGWDNDRATFFAQVLQDYVDATGDEVRVDRVREGAGPHEVRTAREAIDAVRQRAHIPDELEDQLEDDAGQPEHRVATVHTADHGTRLWSEGVMTDWSESEPTSVWGMLALSNVDTDDDSPDLTGVGPLPDLVDPCAPSQAPTAFPSVTGLGPPDTPHANDIGATRPIIPPAPPQRPDVSRRAR